MERIAGLLLAMFLIGELIVSGAIIEPVDDGAG